MNRLDINDPSVIAIAHRYGIDLRAWAAQVDLELAQAREETASCERLFRALAACAAAAGNPDPAEGCRQVIRIVREVTDAPSRA